MDCVGARRRPDQGDRRGLEAADRGLDFLVYLDDAVYPDATNGTQTCWTWGRDRVDADNDLLVAEMTRNEWRIYRKDYLHGDDEVVTDYGELMQLVGRVPLIL